MTFERMKVGLALWLVRKTPCAVVRMDAAKALIWDAIRLKQYAEISGGLNDPGRIKAYKIVLRTAHSIASEAGRLLAGQRADLLTDHSMNEAFENAKQNRAA